MGARSGGRPAGPEGALPAYWGGDTGREQLAAVRRFTPAGGSVLDLGAGRGAYTVALRGEGYRAVGADRTAYPEWKARPEDWFRVVEADALPFEDGSFDTTLALEVLEHCPDVGRVLTEIARCTRGHLVLSVPDCDLDNRLRDFNLVPAHWIDRTHCQLFVKETLVEAVQAAGFAVCEVGGCVKISPNAYFWNTLRIPRRIARLGRRLCERLDLVETYWSSILLVARAPSARG